MHCLVVYASPELYLFSTDTEGGTAGARLSYELTIGSEATASGTERILGLYNINAAKEKLLKMKVSAIDKPLFAEMRR